MLRPLTVDRVGALGEGCQVSGPEVVTGDGSDEQRALGHLSELGGGCLLEDAEMHCGSPYINNLSQRYTVLGDTPALLAISLTLWPAL